MFVWRINISHILYANIDPAYQKQSCKMDTTDFT